VVFFYHFGIVPIVWYFLWPFWNCFHSVVFFVFFISFIRILFLVRKYYSDISCGKITIGNAMNFLGEITMGNPMNLLRGNNNRKLDEQIIQWRARNGANNIVSVL